MAIKRIPSNAINSGEPYQDGDLVTGQMVNEVVKVLKDGVNYNKFFIDAMFSGTTEEAIVIGVPKGTPNDVSEDIVKLESYITLEGITETDGLKAFIFRCIYGNIDDPTEITGVVALNYYKYKIDEWIHQYPVSMDTFIQGVSNDFSVYDPLTTLDGNDLFVVTDTSEALPKKITKSNLKETLGVNDVNQRVDDIENGNTPIAFDKTGTDLDAEFIEEAIKEVNVKTNANEQNIEKIVDGTTIVKKAEQDASGNVITTTYETKADATSKKAEIDGRIDTVEGRLDTAEGDIDTLQSTKVDKITSIIGLDLKDNILIDEFKVALGNASQVVSGLMTVEDKIAFDNLMLLFQTDGDNIVNTIAEILEIFQNYPEGEDLVTILASKVDKVAGKQLSTNDLTNTLKDYYDIAYAHSQITDKSNPHNTSFANITDKPTTRDGYGINDVYTKPETYTQQEINALLDNVSSVKGVKSNLLTPTELSNGDTIATNLLTNNGAYVIFTATNVATDEIDSDTVPVSTIVTNKKFVFFDNQEIVFTIGETNSTFETSEDITLKINLLYLDNENIKAVGVEFDGSGTNYLTAKTEVEGAVKELDTRVKANADNVALKVNISDIVNNLTSTDIDKPLSAKQGKVLNDTVALKVNTSDIVNGTITVKKAEQDENGNNIKDTYATVTYVDGKLDKNFSALPTQANPLLTDVLVLNRGTTVQKVTLGNLLSQVDNEIFEVVSVLPTTGVANKIYLVPSSDPKTQNTLDEFIWVDNAWEKIGAVSVDLSNYFNKTDINSMLDGKVDKVIGKGLSDENFTLLEKNKLANLTQVVPDEETIVFNANDELEATNVSIWRYE